MSEYLLEVSNLVKEFPIGDVSGRVIWIVGLPYDSGVVGTLWQVAIEAILGDIQLTANEPFHVRLSEIPFQYLVPFTVPAEGLSYLCPELFRVIYALLVSFFVFLVRLYLVWICHT